MTRKNELALIRERQLAELRAASGKTERFTLDCACAESDRAFQVTFARAPGARRFTCATVEKQERPSSTLDRLQGLFRAPPKG
jgi:hypothetical protein